MTKINHTWSLYAMIQKIYEQQKSGTYPSSLQKYSMGQVKEQITP